MRRRGEESSNKGRDRASEERFSDAELLNRLQPLAPPHLLTRHGEGVRPQCTILTRRGFPSKQAIEASPIQASFTSFNVSTSLCFLSSIGHRPQTTPSPINTKMATSTTGGTVHTHEPLAASLIDVGIFKVRYHSVSILHNS